MGSSRCCLALLMMLLAYAADAQPAQTAIRFGDTVSLIVLDQPALTNKYVAQADGTITVPLIGRVVVVDVTPDQLATNLERRLAEFLSDPEVRVEIDQARRVFVLGAVVRPGPLNLTQDMTLLEALSRAGYSGMSEVIVVRPKDSREPALMDDPVAQTIRVNLRSLERELERGQLSQNLLLTDGDTIYVPEKKGNEIYVSGQVFNPGMYSITNDTTILQALSLAGGITERGASGRVHVVRVTRGDLRSLKPGNIDVLQPGDTVVVPEKVPFPAIDIGPRSDADMTTGRIEFGRALSIRPAAAVKRIGFDGNVFNDGRTANDFTVVAGPELEVALDLRRLLVKAVGDVDFVYFRQFASERSVNRYGSVSAEVMPSRRLRVHGKGTLANTRDRLNSEVDGRVRRFEHALEAGVQFQPWSRLELEVGGRDWDRQIAENATFSTISLQETLTERIRTASATARLRLTPITWFVASGSASTHRFAYFSQKNADATEVSAGLLFKPGGAIIGEGRVGYLNYVGLDPTAPDLRKPIAGVDLYVSPRDQTRVGLTLERTTTNSFEPAFSYAVVDRAGGSIQQGLFRRFDVLIQVYRENFTYSRFATPDTLITPTDDIENTRKCVSELGVRLGAMRVGFNATYVRRVSTVRSGRDYGSLWMTANVTYGAFQARGQ